MTVAALGWVGSALVVLSLAQRDVRRLRQVGLASAILLLAFNLIIGIASMVALNVALVAVNAYRLLHLGSGGGPAASPSALPVPETPRGPVQVALAV